MKNIVLVLGLVAAAEVVAFGLSPTLPQVEFLDTETVTNVPIPSLAQYVRRYTFSMSFAATSSNNVEIAFGTDADNDDALSDDEVSLAAGWDCGEWFIMNTATGERFTADGANGLHDFVGSILLRADGRARTVTFHDGTTPLFPGFSATARSWEIPSDWDMVRLVGRGENIRTGERFSISAIAPGFAIRLE